MAKKQQPSDESPAPPKLASRRAQRHATNFRLGRTIGEKREKPETASERAAARKKRQKKTLLRVVFTLLGLIVTVVILVCLIITLINTDAAPQLSDESQENITPTIEIYDQDSAVGAQITSRMSLFIARAERDFRELGYEPTKAVIPTGKIREVHFYLKDIPGFIKTNTDRSPAVSVEDADRMIRYLKDKGITEFSYIDVRINSKAYWK